MDIQGIPAVKAFKDGNIVAEFTGALPEPHVRNWLAQLGPSPADLLVEEGSAAEARGDLQTAAQRYREAVSQDPGHRDAKSALSPVELQLRAGGNEDELRQRLRSDANDVDAASALSDVLAARGDYEEALDLLVADVLQPAISEKLPSPRRRSAGNALSQRSKGASCSPPTCFSPLLKRVTNDMWM